MRVLVLSGVFWLPRWKTLQSAQSWEGERIELLLGSPIFRAVLFPPYSSPSCPTRGSQRSRWGGRSLPGKLFSYAGHKQEAAKQGKKEHVKPVLVPRFLPLLRIFSSIIHMFCCFYYLCSSLYFVCSCLYYVCSCLCIVCSYCASWTTSSTCSGL